MFTGIVEHIGTVQNIEHSNGNITVTISNAAKILNDCHLGDSISINGVCLTVTAFSFAEGQFTVGISAETLRRTNLGDLHIGGKVNLERAISPASGTRFGGHYVQGHVDGVAEIIEKKFDSDNSIIFSFKFKEGGDVGASGEGKDLVNYIVEKGFICIDGVSLTVTAVDNDAGSFSIMMIEYTQGQVIMPLKNIGDTVNIEVDVSGKAIEKQVALQLEGQIQKPDSPLVKLIEKIVTKKLQELK